MHGSRYVGNQPTPGVNSSEHTASNSASYPPTMKLQYPPGYYSHEGQPSHPGMVPQAGHTVMPQLPGRSSPVPGTPPTQTQAANASVPPPAQAASASVSHPTHMPPGYGFSYQPAPHHAAMPAYAQPSQHMHYMPHPGQHSMMSMPGVYPRGYTSEAFLESYKAGSGRKRSRQEMSMVPAVEYVPYMPGYHPAPSYYHLPPGYLPQAYLPAMEPHPKKEKKSSKKSADRKSAFRGVFWNSQSKVWISSITAFGRKKHLGCFDEEREAALAYDREALKLKGSLATINFSDSVERFKAEEADPSIAVASTRHVRKRAEKTSKYRGVCWNKYNQSWKACIKVSGKNKHLGYFNSEIDAAKAYDEVSKQHRGKKAKLNFPDGFIAAEKAKKDEIEKLASEKTSEQENVVKTVDIPKQAEPNVLITPKVSPDKPAA